MFFETKYTPKTVSICFHILNEFTNLYYFIKGKWIDYFSILPLTYNPIWKFPPNFIPKLHFISCQHYDVVIDMKNSLSLYFAIRKKPIWKLISLSSDNLDGLLNLWEFRYWKILISNCDYLNKLLILRLAFYLVYLCVSRNSFSIGL